MDPRPSTLLLVGALLLPTPVSMPRLGSVLIALLLAAGCRAGAAGTPTPTEPEPDLAPGDHTVALRHAGLDRRYLLHVPSAAGPLPALVIALHGGGGTAQGFKDENGLDAVSDREGFLAVYPDGSGPLSNRLLTWNAGPNCCGWALDNEVDDVGFLLSVLDDLATRIAFDPRRVYMTGHSNGAMTTYRFALEASDRVAAIVPVGGAMLAVAPQGSMPIPLLHIHSVDDPRALYGGGEGPAFPGTDRTVVHRPVVDGLGYWAVRNGCSTTPVEADHRTGQGVDRGQSSVRLTWPNCEAPVEHIRLSGSGHGWPGVRLGALRQSIVGRPTTLVDASEEVWAFASRYRR